jgi:solute:Na+ symporter, SSS family
MSIAAANLWTRNVYKAYINRNATHAQEAQQSKIMSLFVKVGALVFVLGISTQFALDLQLLGGVWILQTFPAIVVGLYTGWFHRWALLAGWAVGMIYGTWTAWNNPKIGDPDSHFGSPLDPFLSVPWSETFLPFETTIYIGFTAFLLNIVVVVVLTAILRAMGVSPGVDQTAPADYHADEGDVGVEDELDPLATTSHP